MSDIFILPVYFFSKFLKPVSKNQQTVKTEVEQNTIDENKENVLRFE